jgi:hypothetical protein
MKKKNLGLSFGYELKLRILVMTRGIYLGLVYIFEATCKLHLYVCSCFPCNVLCIKVINMCILCNSPNMCDAEWSL